MAASLCAAAGPASAEAPAESRRSRWVSTLREHVSLSGEADVEFALGTDRGRTQKFELTLEPELEVRLPADILVTAIGRMRADGYDRLEPGEPDQPARSDASKRGFAGDRVEFELREAHFEAWIADAYVNLGKQQIVWGQADGLKVLDVVNPQNFREFILEPFEDSRIPLWTANVEVALGPAEVQVVWIPDKTYHDFVEPDSGGVFEFTSPRVQLEAPPGVEVEINDPKRPSHFFEDSDAGARIKAFVGGWDLTFNYLYHYFDFPAPFVSLELRGLQPTAVVNPRYKRTHLVGGTFSNAFGDLTVRGELAFQNERYFTARDGDGVVKAKEILYVLGFDWYGFRDTLLSVQMFQSALASDPTDMVRDQVDTVVTVLAQRTFLRETLRLRAIWLGSPNDGDGLARGELSYDWTDWLTTWIGGDVFYGKSKGLFGQFDDADRFVVGLRVSR